MKRKEKYVKAIIVAGMDFSWVTKEERNRWNLVELLESEELVQHECSHYPKKMLDLISKELRVINMSKVSLNYLKTKYLQVNPKDAPHFTFVLFNYHFIARNPFLMDSKEEGYEGIVFNENFYEEVTYKEVLRLFRLKEEEYTKEQHEEKRTKDVEEIIELKKEQAIEDVEALKTLNKRLLKIVEKEKSEKERVEKDYKELEKEFTQYKKEVQGKRIVFSEKRLYASLGFDEHTVVEGIKEEEIYKHYIVLSKEEEKYLKEKNFKEVKRVSIQKYILVSIMGELENE